MSENANPGVEGSANDAEGLQAAVAAAFVREEARFARQRSDRYRARALDCASRLGLTDPDEVVEAARVFARYLRSEREIGE